MATLNLSAVPGVPTQVAAAVGIVLAWLDPSGQLPHGITQGAVIGALAFVVAAVHWAQAYHRRTVATSTTAAVSAPAAPPVIGS